MTNEDKSNKDSDKKSLPDFDELLRQEQERIEKARLEGESKMPHEKAEMPEHDDLESHEDLMKDHDEISSELDDLLESSDFDYHDDEEPLLQEDHSMNEYHPESDLNPELIHENPEDNEEFHDLGHALESTDDATQSASVEDHFGGFDDSTEFNIDDDDELHVETPEIDMTAAKAQRPKQGLLSKLFSGGSIFYIIIIVVIFGGGYLIYDLFTGAQHPTTVKHVGQAQDASQVVQGSHSVGFHPQAPKVIAEKPKLPPAIPQNVGEKKTTTMSLSNEQILGGQKGATYTHGANGITLLQVNKAELAQLLDNFKATVAANNKKVVTEIGSLNSALGKINQTQGKTDQDYTGKLTGIDAQINLINKKFDSYNKHMGDINKALTQTQQQLKLILAQRAENIQRYTLRAVVPGRAWLVNAQGKTITLTVGQKLQDYGKVVDINNKMGFVKMSSGFVFK